MELKIITDPSPISWKNTCLPKSKGDIGLINLQEWNRAIIAKLVWTITSKKDTLWVKWIHGKYLKEVDWWFYEPCCVKNVPQVHGAGCSQQRQVRVVSAGNLVSITESTFST